LADIALDYYPAHSAFANLMFTYNNLMDNGNTQHLLDEIQGNWGSDVWALRERYLAASPFLSQEVLMELAEWNLLPQAIYLEICLANVDATRSYGFLDFLRYKISYPLPEYMLQLIEANWTTTTIRSTIESNLAYYGAEKDRLLNQILNEKIMDTTANNFTEINALLAERGNYSDMLSIAENQIEARDYNAAYGAVHHLWYEYPRLTAEEREELLDMLNYSAFIANLNVSIYALSEEQLLQLMDMYENSTGRSKVLIRNLLCYVYELCPEESDTRSLAMPNSSNGNNGNATNLFKNFFVQVMPNPAKEYCTFAYDFGDYTDNAMLSIADITGKELLSRKLAGSQGQWVWDTRKMANGVYLYNVTTAQGIRLEAGKIVVLK
jgi:hypothetical protein